MKDINHIDLRHLLYFVTVAELSSFSRAAEHLSMAQPPLSQQIRDLEHRLGTALFLRSNRRIMLTEAGQALLPEAKKILSQTRNTLQRIQKIGQGRAGLLRIGLNSTSPYNPVVQNYIKRFTEKYPDVELDITMHSSAEQRSLLMEGKLDLGFHWPWEGLSEPGLETRHLAPQEFCIALPQDHALAGRKTIDPLLLKDERWFVPRNSRNPGWHSYAMSIFAQAGFMPNHLQEKDPAPLILTLIAAGQGAAFIPDFMKFSHSGIACIRIPAAYRRSHKICMALSKRKIFDSGLTANFFRIHAPSIPPYP